MNVCDALGWTTQKKRATGKPQQKFSFHHELISLDIGKKNHFMYENCLEREHGNWAE